MSDSGLPPSNNDHRRLALVLEDRQNATYFPAAGWPSDRTLYGFALPAPVTGAAFRTSPLFPLGPETLYQREGDMDIASLALAAAGVREAAQAAWLIMNGNGRLCSPVVRLDFAVYRLRDPPSSDPNAVTRRHPNQDGPRGCAWGRTPLGRYSKGSPPPRRCHQERGRPRPGEFPNSFETRGRWDTLRR